MIVVTGAGGTPEDCALYRRIIDKQAEKCKEFGYSRMVFDLGGLGHGAPFAIPKGDFEPQVNGDSLPAATFKAALVTEALYAALPGELVMWMDADCIPLKEFEPPGAFDAAVTLRSDAEIGLSNNRSLDFLNSGVVWIRNNERGRVLCERWRALSAAMNTDQGALNEAVAPGAQANEWKELRGKVHNGVLVLDAMEWNRWFPPPSPCTRILHFKRGIRGQAANYL